MTAEPNPSENEPAIEGKTPEDTPEPAWIVHLEWYFIFFMLYCLSIGPMYWRWYFGKYSSAGLDWVAVLYEPLWQLGQLIPPFGAWLDAYVRWWVLG
ncbi:MAG: hypothetical protein R3C18_17275 [Planctomycetaceae bacterium]